MGWFRNLNSNDRLILNSTSTIPSSSNLISFNSVNRVARAVEEVSTAGVREEIPTENVIDRQSLSDVDNKFNAIFSTLKLISEVMGISLPANDADFVNSTRMIVEGHGNAFEEVAEA